MMKKMLYEKEYIRIGQIRRAHGYKGLAKVSVDEVYMEDLREQQFVFIGIDGYHVPFEIEELSEQRDVLIKLTDIDSSEALSRYHLADLFLLRDDIKHADFLIERSEQYHTLKGMMIVDENSDVSLSIDRIEEYPSQLMAVVILDDNSERLIPLHPDLIVSIDQETQTVSMSLPDGLLD